MFQRIKDWRKDRKRRRAIRRIIRDDASPDRMLAVACQAATLEYMVRYHPVDGRPMTLSEAANRIREQAAETGDPEHQGMCEALMPEAMMAAWGSLRRQQCPPFPPLSGSRPTEGT